MKGQVGKPAYGIELLHTKFLSENSDHLIMNDRMSEYSIISISYITL